MAAHRAEKKMPRRVVFGAVFGAVFSPSPESSSLSFSVLKQVRLAFLLTATSPSHRASARRLGPSGVEGRWAMGAGWRRGAACLRDRAKCSWTGLSHRFSTCGWLPMATRAALRWRPQHSVASGGTRLHWALACLVHCPHASWSAETADGARQEPAAWSTLRVYTTRWASTGRRLRCTSRRWTVTKETANAAGHPSSAATMYTIATVFASSGDPDKALAVYEEYRLFWRQALRKCRCADWRCVDQ